MLNKKIEGNIVADYYIGPTHIMVSDACYRDKTKEEIERIWERVSQIAWNIVLSERAKGRTDI